MRGEAGALELLVLLLVHQGADAAPGSARLRLSTVPAGARARLELEVEADGLAEDAGRAFAEPASVGDPLARNQLSALADLAARHGGSCTARREGACRLLATVELPALGHA